MELPAISLRNATAMQFAKWNIAFDNVVIMHNLAQVVADKNPPTREAVEKLYPDKEYEDIDVIHHEMMRQYQAENTELFFLIASSINTEGTWESTDLEYIQERFTSGPIRDGNGYLQYFQSKHDLQSVEKQIAMRAELNKTKFHLEMSRTQLLKTMLDALSIWAKLGDNDKSDAIKLNAYYRLILEKMPSSPPESNLVRVRVRLAELVYANAATLANPATT